MKALRFPLLLGATVIALSACSGLPHGDNAMIEESQLQGDAWQVQSLNGTTVDDATITLDFHAPGKLAGRSACNRYMAGYSLQQGFKVTLGGVTMMACPGPRMHLEQQFLDLLQAVDSAEVDNNGRLILSGPDGQRIEASR